MEINKIAENHLFEKTCKNCEWYLAKTKKCANKIHYEYNANYDPFHSWAKDEPGFEEKDLPENNTCKNWH